MMHRTVRFFITLLALVSLAFPAYTAGAATQVNCPYDLAGLSIVYGCMDSKSQQLYVDMYNAIRAGKSSVDVPSGLSMDKTDEVLAVLSREASELIAFDYGNTTISYTGSGSSKVPKTVNIAYGCTVAEQDKYIQKLTGICAAFKTKDAESGIRAIHDYVCGVITYDRQALGSGQRFYDALSTHKGVCSAYAQGMAVLCHFSGFTCSFVSGTCDGNGHAWNLVKYGNKYTYVDATWDDRDGGSTDVYFGIGYDRLYRNRSNGSDITVYASLPRGEETHQLISSESGLTSALKNASGTDVRLEFTPAMYAAFSQLGNGVYNTLAKYGIASNGYINYDEAFVYTFENCQYYQAFTFSRVQNTVSVSGLDGSTPRNFMLVTDQSTMNWLLSNWKYLYNALALKGLVPDNYDMSYSQQSCYCLISNATWQSVKTFGSEAELKKLLSNAKSSRLSSLTIVGELGYYETIMSNSCSKFKQIMQDAGVYGSWSYDESGAITLSTLSY